MRLWTFQARAVADALVAGRSHVARWPTWDDAESRCCSWMMREHESRVGPVGEAAPIWAWHSCGKVGGPPTRGTARSLLSDLDLKLENVVIELDCPDSIPLLSSYAGWNRYFLTNDRPDAKTIFRYRVEELVPGTELPDQDDIQACLPCIDPEWVVSCRPLEIRLDLPHAEWDAPLE
jgi:hypothetical protein